MKQLKLLLFPFFVFYHICSYSQIPLNNLVVWLSADSAVLTDGSNNVYEWTNLANPALHATQSNNTYKPVYFSNIDSLNNQPLIKFDSDFLTINDSIKIGTFFITCNHQNNTFPYFNGLLSRVNTTDGITDFLLVGNGGTTTFYSSIATPNLFVNGTTNTSNFAPLRTFKLLRSKLASPVSWSNLNIGKDREHFDRFWFGFVGDIIIYDTLLSQAEITQVETYLMNKYALPVQLGPDIFLDYGYCPVKLGVSPIYTSVLWSTGSSADTISINQTGYYSVEVTDIFNRISRDTVFIEFPILSFPDTVICLGDTVEYASILPGPYFYEWSDMSSDSTLWISEAGTYWLKVTDTLGCFITDTFMVAYDSFTLQVSLGNDTSLCSGNTIQLLSGQNEAISYQWFPGNETTPFIEIDTSGWYSVQVQNANGCVATDSLFVTIVGTAPVPDFQYDFLCFGDTALFTDLSVPQGNIAQRIWIVDNTDTLFGQAVQYVFPDTGFHTVKLFVQDTAGCNSQKTEQIQIFPVPTIHIEHNPVCTGTPVLFQGIVTIPPGTTISQQLWLINGMPAGSNSTLLWTFLSEDIYEVQFTVFLDNGCSATETISVQVSDSYPQPGAFNMYAPANNAVLGDTIIQINWNQSTGALLYNLIIATDSLFSNVIKELDSIFTTSVTTSLPGNGEYYLRVVACNPCNICSESNSIKVEIFSPAALPNLKLWLRADSGVVYNGSNKVSQWTNIADPSASAIQTNISLQPVFVNNVQSLNNQSLIKFENSFLNVFDSIKIGTVFITCNFENPTFPEYSGLLTGVNDHLLFVGNYFSTTFYPSILTPSLVINGQTNTADFAPLQTFKVLRAGLNIPLTIPDLSIGIDRGMSNRYWKGYIGDIIIFEDVLDQTEISQVETYLMNKYSNPINLGPDIIVSYGFCPVKLGVSSDYTSALWSTGSTNDTITVNQTGHYSVQVVDIFGRLSSDTVYVEFPHFGFQDAVVCLGDSIEYASTMPGPYDYLWSDFSTDDHLFISQAGTYWLRLTDTLGCFITDTFAVAVDSFAVLASLGPDITLCSGDNIGLVSGDQPMHFVWSTTETTPSIIVTSDGTYALTVTNVNGCVAHDSISILIHGFKPAVGFLADSVCFGFSTGFTDTSSAVAPDAIAQWQWTIDGNTISQQNPQYHFPAPGIHTVSLFVETDSGCTATAHQDIFVIPNPQPSFFPLTGCSGEPVQFTNQTTLEYGSIASWEWWATDSLGTIVDQSSATHAELTFPVSGTYQLHLTAVTTDGCRDTTVRSIEIRRSPPVDFIWSNVCIGQITAFNETTDVPPQEMIIERSWNFGDNSTSTLPNPQHQYQATGTYNVSLLNRSINGCENTVTKQVTIHELPVAAFETSLPCLNTPVQFHNTSTAVTGNIVGVMWTFPSGDSTSLWDPVYQFSDTGSYVIGLAVTTDEGCKSSSSQTVVVYPFPNASFTFAPEYGVPPLDVSFTNESEGAVTYAWDFDDGFTSSLMHPEHTYTQTFVYTVELIAKNTFLCSDTTYGTVYVIPSTYDIAVTSAEQSGSGNLIQSHINIRNLGTRIVRSLQLKLQVDNGITVTEQWSGTLLPGEDTWYTFSSLLEEEMLANRKVVCYSAMPDEDVEDDDLQNNTWCKVLEPGFYIMSVAPNPASTEILISIVLSADGPYEFEMNSADGRQVIEPSSLQGSKGLNRLRVDVSHLNQGLYIIRISDPYSSDLHRILIAR